jgi:hypothetical protein
LDSRFCLHSRIAMCIRNRIRSKNIPKYDDIKFRGPVGGTPALYPGHPLFERKHGYRRSSLRFLVVISITDRIPMEGTFSMLSRPAPGSNQFPVQWVPVFPGRNATRVWCLPPTFFYSRRSNWIGATPLPLLYACIGASWCGLYLYYTLQTNVALSQATLTFILEVSESAFKIVHDTCSSVSLNPLKTKRICFI